MTLSGTSTATLIHADIDAKQARLTTELSRYIDQMSFRLDIYGLDSSTPQYQRTREFVVPVDISVEYVRFQVIGPSATVNWTYGIEAINPVTEVAINKWTGLIDWTSTLQTTNATRTGEGLTSAFRLPLVTGVNYRIYATSDSATAGVWAVVQLFCKSGALDR